MFRRRLSPQPSNRSLFLELDSGSDSHHRVNEGLQQTYTVTMKRFTFTEPVAFEEMVVTIPYGVAAILRFSYLTENTCGWIMADGFRPEQGVQPFYT